MRSIVLDYNSRLKHNREVFLLNYKEEFICFDHVIERLNEFTTIISKTRDKNKGSHVGLIPFMSFIERQACNSFDLFSKFQSYDAWVLFRPVLESTMLIGKFLDDPKNYWYWENRKEIWKNRDKNKQLYRDFKSRFENYTPKSLPNSRGFKNVLTAINDSFMHVNSEHYLYNNFEISQAENGSFFFRIPFVDDEEFHKAYLYSFLHLFALIVFSIGQAFGSIFDDQHDFSLDLERNQRIWRARVGDLSNKQDTIAIIKKFGLWEIS